jgi:hypothetical protein
MPPSIGHGVSGQYGDAQYGGSTQFSELLGWDAEFKVNTPQYNSNKTGGYKTTVAGTKSWSGNLKLKYDPTNPLATQADVGASVVVKLYLTAVGYYGGTVIIGGHKYTVDLDNGDIVSVDAPFVGSGPWSLPGVGETADDGTGGGAAPAAPMETGAEAAPREETLAPAAVQEMIAGTIQDAMRQLVPQLVQAAADSAVAAVLQMIRPDALLAPEPAPAASRAA